MVKKINETYEFDDEYTEKDERISQISAFINSIMVEFYRDYKKSYLTNGSARNRFMIDLAKDIDSKIIDYYNSNETY